MRTEPRGLFAVQFPHPGGEHGADRPGWKGWNLGGHKRKFLTAAGLWITHPDDSPRENDGDLVFWGEWEPPSRVIAELSRQGRGDPGYLHEPVWTYPPDHPKAQNTDPFVFGDQFLYSNCKQNTKNGPRKTQRLGPGSLILFGSHLGGDFVLDTVFVVARSRALDEESILEPDIDPVFRAVTGDLLVPRDDGMTFRLYEGATPEKPVGGMYSFVPCRPFDAAQPGFRRPAIQVDGVINPALKMGLKMEDKIDSIETMGSVWENVVGQVLDQDLALGVSIATPNRHGARNEPIPRTRGDTC